MQSCLDCKHFRGYTQFHCQPYFVICPQDLRNFPCPYKLGMANPFCNPGTSIRLPGVSHLVRSGVPSLAVQQGQVRYPFRDEVYLRLISRTEKRKHFGHLRTTMPMETCKPSNLDSTRYIEQILILPSLAMTLLLNTNLKRSKLPSNSTVRWLRMSAG